MHVDALNMMMMCSSSGWRAFWSKLCGLQHEGLLQPLQRPPHLLWQQPPRQLAQQLLLPRSPAHPTCKVRR